MKPASIKDQLLEVSRDYLGPAADRFIDRQISTHLRKRPERVTRQDITNLIDWLKLSLALLTDDTGMVEEYVHRLRLIAAGRAGEALSETWQR